jgi:uncharacterized membrane protein
MLELISVLGMTTFSAVSLFFFSSKHWNEPTMQGRKEIHVQGLERLLQKFNTPYLIVLQTRLNTAVTKIVILWTTLQACLPAYAEEN